MSTTVVVGEFEGEVTLHAGAHYRVRYRGSGDKVMELTGRFIEANADRLEFSMGMLFGREIIDEVDLVLIEPVPPSVVNVQAPREVV